MGDLVGDNVLQESGGGLEGADGVGRGAVGGLAIEGDARRPGGLGGVVGVRVVVGIEEDIAAAIDKISVDGA